MKLQECLKCKKELKNTMGEVKIDGKQLFACRECRAIHSLDLKTFELSLATKEEKEKAAIGAIGEVLSGVIGTALSGIAVGQQSPITCAKAFSLDSLLGKDLADKLKAEFIGTCEKKHEEKIKKEEVTFTAKKSKEGTDSKEHALSLERMKHEEEKRLAFAKVAAQLATAQYIVVFENESGETESAICGNKEAVNIILNSDVISKAKRVIVREMSTVPLSAKEIVVKK